jgi:hypothetical protein
MKPLILAACAAALLVAGCNDQAAKYLPWETAKFKSDCAYKRGFSEASIRRAYDGRPIVGPTGLGAVKTFAVQIKPPITLEQSASCFEPMAPKPAA